MKGRFLRIAAACAALAVSVSTFSCATLPLAPSAAQEAADRVALAALPPKAGIFIVLRPALLPVLAESAINGMNAADRPQAKEILARSRGIWASFSPPSGGEPGGKGIFYAILSGRYQGALMRSGLASAKGAVKGNGYFALPDGLKIAVEGDRYVLITNADMDSLLSRYRRPEARIEGSEPHPAWSLLPPSGDAPLPGIALLVPEPVSLPVPSFLEGIAEIPLERIEARGREVGARLDTEISFTFNSDNSARIFSPAARMLGLGLAKAMGASPGGAQAGRTGRTVSIAGISVAAKDFATVLLNLAAKPK
jgi:hypothetical protein